MSEDLLSRPDSRRPGGFQVAINHQDGKGFQFPSARLLHAGGLSSRVPWRKAAGDCGGRRLLWGVECVLCASWCGWPGLAVGGRG